MERNKGFNPRFVFGEFVLDTADAVLTRCGERIALAPKEFALLCVLINRAGHLVHKEELIREVWPTTFVSDSSLLRNISMLRRSLGHESIRTVPKRGYVFVLPVEQLETSNPPDSLIHPPTKEEPDPLARAQNLSDGRLESGVVQVHGPKAIAQTESELSHAASGHSRWPTRGTLRAVVALLGTILVLATGGLVREPHLHASHQPASGPQPLAATPRAAAAVRLFVVNQNEDSISVVNGLTNTVRFKVPIAGNPRGAAIVPDGKTVYVSLNAANAVAALDARTRQITAIIPVGISPVGIAANPRPPFVYVANNYSNSVSVIDTRTNTVVQTVAVGSVPTEIAITPDGTRALVTNQSGGTVTILNTVANTVLATLSVGSTPVGVAFTPDSKFAWITLAGEDQVAVLDVVAKRVVGHAGAGHGPVRVVISNDGRYALISDFFSNTLTVIETASLQPIREIPVGLNPVGIALDAPGDFAFVANYGSNTVSVVDMRTMRVVSNFDVGRNPVEMVALPCFKVPCSPQRSERNPDIGGRTASVLPVMLRGSVAHFDGGQPSLGLPDSQ